MNTFTVNSSWGTIVVDADTGVPIRTRSDYDPDPRNEQGDYPIRNIVRFDVEEWRRTYPNEVLDGSNLDILDLGYQIERVSGGIEYAPPEEDWRKVIRRGLMNGTIQRLL